MVRQDNPLGFFSNKWCLMMRRCLPRLVAVGVGLLALLASAAEPETPSFRFIATWSATQPAVSSSRDVMLNGGKLLDAIEQGVRVEEQNVKNASVGIGGLPNADGVVQLDACIMNGPGHQAGAVAALEDILHPISVARRVMEATKHVMLVGDGARKFALENGFAATELLTQSQREAWQKRRASEAAKAAKAAKTAKTAKAREDELTPAQHDTIALLGVDAEGNIAGGCSTSGWGYKLPGRVGDSPIIGSGLYVDNEVGAAGATGIGENVMRYCGSFMVVEAMRQGKSPQAACEEVVRRIAAQDPSSYEDIHINFVAINKAGEVGAAGTDQGFNFATADQAAAESKDAAWIQE